MRAWEVVSEDDAGQFVTVEDARPGSALMFEDFEALGGAAFVASARRRRATRHLTVLTFGTGVRMGRRASVLPADEGVRACARSACAG
jgi:hypothetical protein